MMYEIEQKFTYESKPTKQLEMAQHTIVYRQYLSLDPEVRINRRVFDNGEERFNLSIKSDNYLERAEIKIRLTKEQYWEINEINDNEDMVFEVYEFKLDDTHLISFKEGKNIDVSFAEVEYCDMEDFTVMQSVIKCLSFLKEDVTNNDNYYVKNIWRRFCEQE